jgi:FKBP-type peptidyl-prolyl cis-trans isomerase (trigger factor)
MIDSLLDYNDLFVEDKNQEENIEEIKQNILTQYNFKLPIEYNKHLKLIDTVKNDVEMNKMIKYIYNYSNNNNSNTNNMQYNLLNNNYYISSNTCVI